MLALVIGAVYTLVGILGFEVNPLHNLVHLVNALAGLAIALWPERPRRPQRPQGLTEAVRARASSTDRKPTLPSAGDGEAMVRELRLWAAAVAGPAAAAGFHALAALRRRRGLHPTGIGYRGRLVVGDAGRPGVSLFRSGASYPALLRFSRGAGLPEPLPDALGVAVKLPHAHGPGRDQDLLLTSSTDRPLLRRLLFPARSFLRGAFSTALPYDLGGEHVVLLLVPVRAAGRRSAAGRHRRGGSALSELRAAADGLRFELRAAGSVGRSQPLAVLTVGEPLPAEETEMLRFDPWTTGPGIRPSGWLNLLRAAAYRASQRGRQQRPSHPPSTA